MLRDWTPISLETILTVDSQIDEISSSTSIFVVIFINNIKIHETDELKMFASSYYLRIDVWGSLSQLKA